MKKKQNTAKKSLFAVPIAIAIWILAGCSNTSPAPHPLSTPHPQVVSSQQSDRPVEIKQPQTAADVVADLHGTRFQEKPLGDARVLWGMTSGGTFYLHGQKYGVNVFNSEHLMRRWLRTAKQYGVVPRYETHTAVVYPSVLG